MHLLWFDSLRHVLLKSLGLCSLLGSWGGVCNLHHVAFTFDNMDTIKKLYIYTERVNNNQINDKQWHRTKRLKPKILPKFHTHITLLLYLLSQAHCRSDNTHRPLKIIPSKNYKITYFKTVLTYITHSYTASIFVYSVKYKCTNIYI